jgi:phosphoribosylformimino-5-aminoimidazole carboxamide ribotide isomerase
MRIIPAIDIIEGKCVRLFQGDYNQKTIYNENPLEVAKSFEDAGLKYLHVVDLDGAKQGKIVNHKVLEKITSKTSLIVDFGGGISSDEMIKIPFECGAAQVTLGSIAVKSKETVEHWLKVYGADKIIIGADVNNERIQINGWQEDSKVFVYDFLAEYVEAGIKYSVCTDISKDGTLKGPSIDLYKKIKEHFKDLNLIASGGIGSLHDVEACDKAGLEGCIIGKAIYEGKIRLDELHKFVG